MPKGASVVVFALAACGAPRAPATGPTAPATSNDADPPAADDESTTEAPRADASGVFQVKDTFAKRGTTLDCRPSRPESALRGIVRIEPFGHGLNGAIIEDGARRWIVSYRAGAAFRQLDGRLVEAYGRQCVMEGQAIVGGHFTVRTLRPLDAGAPSAIGSLPREAIESVIRARFDRIRQCFDGNRHPQPGHIAVRFVINPSGAVSTVTVEDDGAEPDAIVSCVVHRFEDLAFPKPENAGRVTVVYPVRLAP